MAGGAGVGIVFVSVMARFRWMAWCRKEIDRAMVAGLRRRLVGWLGGGWASAAVFAGSLSLLLRRGVGGGILRGSGSVLRESRGGEAEKENRAEREAREKEVRLCA